MIAYVDIFLFVFINSVQGKFVFMYSDLAITLKRRDVWILL